MSLLHVLQDRQQLLVPTDNLLVFVFWLFLYPPFCFLPDYYTFFSVWKSIHLFSSHCAYTWSRPFLFHLFLHFPLFSLISSSQLFPPFIAVVSVWYCFLSLTRYWSYSSFIHSTFCLLTDVIILVLYCSNIPRLLWLFPISLYVSLYVITVFSG